MGTKPKSKAGLSSLLSVLVLLQAWVCGLWSGLSSSSKLLSAASSESLRGTVGVTWFYPDTVTHLSLIYDRLCSDCNFTVGMWGEQEKPELELNSNPHILSWFVGPGLDLVCLLISAEVTLSLSHLPDIFSFGKQL